MSATVPKRAGLICFTLAVLVAAAAPPTAGAQYRRDGGADWLTSANSESENYLRTLQLTGASAMYPWSLRGFSARELRLLAPGDSAHPWSAAFAQRAPSAHWGIITPEVGAIYNSGFPYGSNDGPVWAGRGLTSTASLGLRAEYGPLDVVFAPQFFRAENASFPLAPNGLTGRLAFANAHTPNDIDRPQRFGDAPYQRLDPGQSTVRLTVAGLTAGVSTANEFWGPAVEEPFLFSNNSAGFRHVFAGTARPLGIGGIGVHVHAIAGKLEQSDFSSTDMAGRGRYVSGLVGVVTARQLPGLEVGAGRVFENIFADSVVSFGRVVRPVLEGLLKSQRARALGTATGNEPDNQLGSVFFRWAFPASGFEFYGEYGREDHAYNLRDLALEPDHDVGTIVGLRKAWRLTDRRIVLLRSEIFNDRVNHLDAVRGETPPYVHGEVTQGHTNLGQILGAPDLNGGGGYVLAVEDYSPRGRATLEYARTMRVQQFIQERSPGVSPFDVIHSIRLERMLFLRGLDFTHGITAAYEVNRDLSGDDRLNIRLAAGLRAHW